MFELNKKDQGPAGSDRASATDRDHRTSGSMGASGSQTSPVSGGMAVIGRSIQINGDLRGEEDLRIEGDIDGKIHLPNHSLTIGKEGRINANVYAKSVTIDGEMNGDAYGSECVNIRANASVVGNVVASRVSLEEGARFKGSIDMDPESVKAALDGVRGATTSKSELSRPNGAGQPSARVADAKPAAAKSPTAEAAG